MTRLALALALTIAGCGEPEVELREWQPSDHQHPSGAATAGRAAPPPERDPDPAATEARAATALFRAMCGSCHGESGRGDGPGRPPAAQMDDITTAAWQDAHDDAEIAEVIRAGRGGFMPAFGDRLSAPGIEALVRHVRRLDQRRLGGREGAGETAPEAP